MVNGANVCELFEMISMDDSGTETKIDAVTGELMFRGRNVFMGKRAFDPTYHKPPLLLNKIVPCDQAYMMCSKICS